MKLLSLESTGKMDVKSARQASVVNLLCWPVAAMLYWMGLGVLAYIVTMIAVFSLFIVMRTGLFRIVGGRIMDDVEMEMQRRAYSYAYSALGCTIMLGLLITYIGYDTLRTNAPDLLSLKTHEVLSFLLWMAIDVMLILPAAFLAWLLPIDEIEDE